MDQGQAGQGVPHRTGLKPSSTPRHGSQGTGRGSRQDNNQEVWNMSLQRLRLQQKTGAEMALEYIYDRRSRRFFPLVTRGIPCGAFSDLTIYLAACPRYVVLPCFHTHPRRGTSWASRCPLRPTTTPSRTCADTSGVPGCVTGSSSPAGARPCMGSTAGGAASIAARARAWPISTASTGYRSDIDQGPRCASTPQQAHEALQDRVPVQGLHEPGGRLGLQLRVAGGVLCGPLSH